MDLCVWVHSGTDPRNSPRYDGPHALDALLTRRRSHGCALTVSHRAPQRLLAAAVLLERRHELATIEAAMAQAQEGAGSAVLIEGEAGIGKSTLARHAVDLAAERGLRVLLARAGELERSLPYGVVMELFGAIANDPAQRNEIFAGPARIAAPLFGLGRIDDALAHDGIDRADPVAYVHGLFWLVLNLVERGPVAIVVDDVQWADEPSIRFLHHLARRVGELPVALVLAMRPEAGAQSSGAAMLRGALEVTLLTPSNLSEGGVGELLSELLDRPVSEAVRRAAWSATGGNPLFVTELAAEMDDGREPDPGAIADAAPKGVGRYLDARLAAAQPQARAIAEAVAILGESATLHRAAAIAGIEASDAAPAARWLVEAAILADAEPLAFRHPLLRGAVAAAMTGPARAELHRRAGLLLAAEGVDAGVVGAQLHDGAARGDRAVVDLLARAAGDASGRGEPQTAIRLLRRALAEPPAPDQRLDVLLALARAEAAASAPGAPATFAEALSLVEGPAARAELQLELGHALLAASQWPMAYEAFSAGLKEAPLGAESLRARLESGYLSSAWITMGDRGEIEKRVRTILEADELGVAYRGLAAWIAFHQGAVVGSTAAEMGGLVRKVFAEAPIRTLVNEGQTVEIGVGLLLETDDLQLEVDILTRAIEAARSTGPIAKAGMYSYCRAWPSYFMGRLTDAIADGEEAIRAAELGWEAFVPAAVAVTAQAYIERDELDNAAATLSIDPHRWAGRIDTAMVLPIAEGRLALARGEPAKAAEHLRRAGDGAGVSFMRNTVPTDWRSWYATALFRLERRDEARAVANENVEIARQWGAAWPLGAALRVQGLVQGGPGGIATLREARELLEDGPAQLEHARVLVTLGATIRRNGGLTEARAVLKQAADRAQRLGARALLRRATDELRAAGSRRRRVALTGIDALTPAELRVAQEALAGRTNREIAGALFVTPKAVEFHLANTYRKLGIAGRAELESAMSEGSAAR